MDSNNGAEKSDVLRDTWLRYLGYATVIGETLYDLDSEANEDSMNARLFTAGITNIYILADVIIQSIHRCEDVCNLGKIFVAYVDTTIFHTLSSVIIPGAVVRVVSWVSNKTLTVCKVNEEIVKKMSSIVGILSLLYFSEDIDRVSHSCMDFTFRQLYGGYTNEVGEAFRPLIPKKLVHLSYGVATTYVLADVVTKTENEYKLNGEVKAAAKVAVDVFLWQMLASVAIPGLTINKITALSTILLASQPKMNAVQRIVPTVIGLLSIPLIVKPIDDFVSYFMDSTYRKFV